jgi:hypothetical protein
MAGKVTRWLRRGTVMILGAILIVDALTEGRFEVVPFVVGLLMVGLVPIDAIIDAAMGGGQADADLEKRLKQALDDKDKN